MKILLFTVTALALGCALGNDACAAEKVGPREIWESEEYRSVPRKPPATFTKLGLEISPEVYWIFYEEPSLSVEWTGIMYGANVTLTQRLKSRPIVGRLETHYAAGRVDYDGFLSNGTPHDDQGTDWILDSRLLLGYETAMGPSTVTPFLGIAFRYWFDDLESVNAYRRQVRYLYSPLGLETLTPLAGNWSWGARAEFDLFWRGWVDSHLEDVNASFNTVKNTQKQGFGARGSVYFKREGEKWSVAIEPFIRYWDIDDSDTAPLTFSGVLIGSGVEPANRTVESGLQVSVLF